MQCISDLSSQPLTKVPGCGERAKDAFNMGQELGALLQQRRDAKERETRGDEFNLHRLSESAASSRPRNAT
eukprot:9362940-Pyramimonas_sp.AAC.1